MNSMKVTLSTNTTSNEIMAKFSDLRALGESRAVEDIISFDDRRRINTTATRAPPTSMPMAVDVIIADEAAAVKAADDTILDSISDCKSYVI